MEYLIVALLIITIILIIWTFCSFRRNVQKENSDRNYLELGAKMNYLTATGSVFIILATYLGYNNELSLKKEYEAKISDFISKKSFYVDSVINSKDILRAGTYIVNDLNYIDNKKYKFEDLTTINNKKLPKFSFAPKLIINVCTGENFRVIEVTNEYFILGRPLSKNNFLVLDQDNANYPKVIKFDVWIADYKMN